MKVIEGACVVVVVVSASPHARGYFQNRLVQLVSTSKGRKPSGEAELLCTHEMLNGHGLKLHEQQSDGGSGAESDSGEDDDDEELDGSELDAEAEDNAAASDPYKLPDWDGDRSQVPLSSLRPGTGANNGTIVTGTVVASPLDAGSMVLVLADFADSGSNETMYCCLNDVPESVRGTTMLNRGAVISLRDPHFGLVFNEHYGVIVNRFADICIDAPSEESLHNEYEITREQGSVGRHRQQNHSYCSLTQSISEHRASSNCARAQQKNMTAFTRNNDKERSDELASSSRLTHSKKGKHRGDTSYTGSQAEHLREEGNSAFKAGNWLDAYKLYGQALDVDPDDAKTLANRAEVDLKRYRWRSALENAHAALERSKESQLTSKCVLRQARALAALNQYVQALELASNHVSASASLQSTVQEAERLVLEQAGVVDLSRFYLSHTNGSLLAEHIGPITLSKQGGKKGGTTGSKLVTAEDVAPGDLLWIAPPIEAVVSNKRVAVNTAGSESSNLMSRLRHALKNSLHSNVRAREALADKLNHASGTGNNTGRWVPKMNVECSEKAPNGVVGEDDESGLQSEIDKLAAEGARSAQRLRLSHFDGEDQQRSRRVAWRSADREYVAAGLWLPFIATQHSCCPNALWVLCRGCMIVRAARQLPKGTEISLDHACESHLMRYGGRLHARSIDCKCERCEAEKEAESTAHLIRHERNLAMEAKRIMDKIEQREKPSRNEVQELHGKVCAFENDLQATKLPYWKLHLVRASVAEHYLALAFGLREVEGTVATGLTAWLTGSVMDALDAACPGSHASLRAIALARMSLDVSDVSMGRELQTLVCRYGKEVDVHSLERLRLSIDAQARCMGIRGRVAEAFVCHGVPLISYGGANTHQEVPRMYVPSQTLNHSNNCQQQHEH